MAIEKIGTLFPKADKTKLVGRTDTGRDSADFAYEQYANGKLVGKGVARCLRDVNDIEHEDGFLAGDWHLSQDGCWIVKTRVADRTGLGYAK